MGIAASSPSQNNSSPLPPLAGTAISPISACVDSSHMARVSTTTLDQDVTAYVGVRDILGQYYFGVGAYWANMPFAPKLASSIFRCLLGVYLIVCFYLQILGYVYLDIMLALDKSAKKSISPLRWSQATPSSQPSRRPSSS